MFVKICGITNLDDARRALDAGADALGFNFYRRSVRFIEPQEARRIIEQLPETVLSVGVFVDEETPEAVERIAVDAGINAVQLHGDESPQYCRELKKRVASKGWTVIKALRVSDEFIPESVVEYVEADAILLDAFAGDARGGTGRVFDWSLARRVGQLVPRLFLAGGLSPENISEAVRAVEPYAVDACSRLELAPGRKDADRVRAFVKLAQTKIR